ncbi:hypothetical protein AQZ52_06855 [Novosphingobium fuchskuhlense]|uniref:Lipoprotein n=1 Tax=Novosphingobium fuchskuhlense TaxID=1117702 RepID=A0A117UXY1_9SPHN|nr:hypothetical protein [Novosphingobium fuchskuhlense]KUR72916.1 hypothetical protein AQZ52_06855 [Novosphingobium fuchskuhlense]
MASLSIRLVAPLAAFLALSACSADRSRFPSLAIRPAERAYQTGQRAMPAPPSGAAATADLPARVATLNEKATAAHARFVAQKAAATALINAARSTAPGTEAWSRAAIALAGLSAARGEGMVALSDLDRLLIAATEAAAVGSDTDLQVVAPAHSAIAALLAEEDRTIADLGDRLGG